MKRKRLGRPNVLDDVKQASIVALLSAGCSRRQAAQYVGCAPSTIGYLAGRDRQFAKRLRQAELQTEVRPLTNLMEASGRHWRAAAWLLERQFPQRYGRRQPDLMTRGEFRDALGMLSETLSEMLPTAQQRLMLRYRLQEVSNAMGHQPRWPLQSPRSNGVARRRCATRRSKRRAVQ